MCQLCLQNQIPLSQQWCRDHIPVTHQDPEDWVGFFPTIPQFKSSSLVGSRLQASSEALAGDNTQRNQPSGVAWS